MAGRVAKKSPRSARERLSLESLLWDLGYCCVAGVDEVGLGPLAGPVVAAAVSFPAGTEILELADSKKLSASRRLGLEPQIRAAATAASIGVVEVEELDRLGVQRAGLEAMRRAVLGMVPPADYLLVDAKEIPGLEAGQSAFIGADDFVYSVAAASIVAKVYRDNLMAGYERLFPGYGFARHMGYGTAAHLAALEKLGPSPIHRRSFSPVRRFLSPCPQRA